MNKETYEYDQLFHFLDDVQSTLSCFEKEIVGLKNRTVQMYDEIRTESVRTGIENTFSNIREAVIDDYSSR